MIISPSRAPFPAPLPIAPRELLGGVAPLESRTGRPEDCGGQSRRLVLSKNTDRRWGLLGIPRAGYRRPIPFYGSFRASRAVRGRGSRDFASWSI
jgi:hypothetical protein